METPRSCSSKARGPALPGRNPSAENPAVSSTCKPAIVDPLALCIFWFVEEKNNIAFSTSLESASVKARANPSRRPSLVSKRAPHSVIRELLLWHLAIQLARPDSPVPIAHNTNCIKRHHQTSEQRLGIENVEEQHKLELDKEENKASSCG